MRTHIHHHGYVLEGIVDAAVMTVQAEKRRDKNNENSMIHYHRYGDFRKGVKISCNDKCTIFEVGYLPRRAGEERTKRSEETVS